jgi:hypothetical protein
MREFFSLDEHLNARMKKGRRRGPVSAFVRRSGGA